MFEFDPKQLSKLEALRAAGVAPYPNGLPVPDRIVDVFAAGVPGEEQPDTLFTLAGRVRFKNEMGKAGFLRIQDSSSQKQGEGESAQEQGLLQLYVKKDTVGEQAFVEVFKKLDLGDQIWVVGTLMRTRTGELSLNVKELRLYAKCIESLPDKHKGFHDPEQRQRMRYLDLVINDEVRNTFRIRSAIVRGLRAFFDGRGFMEVETPMLQVIPGGANARPFVTHHNALDIDLYLRIAPELYLKRLVVGGFERVYEVNRNFRNEGISQKHNPEFTMVEFYQAHATWTDLMDLTEALFQRLAMDVLGSHDLPGGISVAGAWPRRTMASLIEEHGGVNDAFDREELERRWFELYPGAPAEVRGRGLYEWWQYYFDLRVEKNLVQPTFVTEFPAEISPLSRRSDSRPEIAERFELFINGMEIANGFSELNDPVDQANRFLAQVKAKEAGDAEAMYFDEDYIRALTYGMPPTAGEGIGVDRLAMLFSGQTSIREVILFPTRKPTAATPSEKE